MKTIQMTLDEELIETVDRLVKKLHTTRSAFTRVALKEAVRKFQISQLEQKHREGYEKYPVLREEFGDWEKEQKWGDK